MERMQSKPLSVVGGPMKSSATLSAHSSGTGNGCRGPGAFVVQDLLHWQALHEGM